MVTFRKKFSCNDWWVLLILWFQTLCVNSPSLFMGLKRPLKRGLKNFNKSLLLLVSFQPNLINPFLFRLPSQCSTYFLVYVYDILLTSDSEKFIPQVLIQFHHQFARKALGAIDYFLNIQTKAIFTESHLSQTKYAFKRAQN